MDTVYTPASPLPLGLLEDTLMLSIYEWATQILEQHQAEGSYAIIVYDEQKDRPFLRLAFPSGSHGAQVSDVPDGIGIHVEIIEDKIGTASSFGNWGYNRVIDPGLLYCGVLSIGCETNVNIGGSFGGFLRSEHDDSKLFGVSAAHVLPNALGSNVCFPSTTELTQRLNQLLPYTTFAANLRYHVSSRKEQEVSDLLSVYSTIPGDSENGAAIIRPGSTTTQIVYLTGRTVGRLAARTFDFRNQILQRHNNMIAGSEKFPVPALSKTRRDVAFFAVNRNIMGSNQTEDGETINEPRVVAPGEMVSKSGRTTRTTPGTVNKGILIRWADGNVSAELAVVSNNLYCCFGLQGDSGSLVASIFNGEHHAAGLLHGMCLKMDVCMMMPYWAVIEAAEETLGAVKFA
ncbi:hypothetical protein EDC01DRAFT_305574 [Geopyxis carbonaria]|nr:hypothetical protein EDC01DRAFT_305574 [Geopyxis carbonaria]